MIQLHIISGKQAGSDIVARRFPFVIGRGPDADVRLDEPGVWERHLEISFKREEGFMFAAQEQATATVNHEVVRDGLLQNGDLIELGSVQLRFWLAPSKQKTARVREALTWVALLALFGVQVWLIYSLL